MAAQITPILIAAFVAFIIAAVVGALTWTQVHREREQLLVDARTAWSVEVHRARLASYPAAFEAMAPLSTPNRAALTAEVAGEVGKKLNAWLYSTGGMCADATTRSAVLGLRDSCDKWATTGGSRPPQLYEFRNLTITFLRRDLDLDDIEPFDLNRNLTLLGKLRDDLEAHERRSEGRTWNALSE